VTPEATGRATGCTHGGGLGEGVLDADGVGLGVGLVAVPPEPVQEASRLAAATAATKALVRISGHMMPRGHAADCGVPA
jgi:hypothetical protein